MKALSIALIALTTTVTSIAMADFNLASNGKAVVCYGEDNMKITLSKSRKTVKISIEGESLGAKRVAQRASDGDTFVAYTTEEGTLTLDDQGDSFQSLNSGDLLPLRCK